MCHWNPTTQTPNLRTSNSNLKPSNPLQVITLRDGACGQGGHVTEMGHVTISGFAAARHQPSASPPGTLSGHDCLIRAEFTRQRTSETFGSGSMREGHVGYQVMSPRVNEEI